MTKVIYIDEISTSEGFENYYWPDYYFFNYDYFIYTENGVEYNYDEYYWLFPNQTKYQKLASVIASYDETDTASLPVYLEHFNARFADGQRLVDQHNTFNNLPLQICIDSTYKSKEFLGDGAGFLGSHRSDIGETGCNRWYYRSKHFYFDLSFYIHHFTKCSDDDIAYFRIPVMQGRFESLFHTEFLLIISHESNIILKYYILY